MKECGPYYLSVSVGYFFNIVRQLLLKQRKQLGRYILLDCEGRLFDSLLQHINHHSFSDLLLELMQLNVAFQPVNKASFGRSSDDESETTT